MIRPTLFLAILVAPAVGLSGCKNEAPAAATQGDTVPVTVTSANGKHVFHVEVARTAEQQERGLMFRTDLKPEGGMIFAPYPPNGGPPRAASFWMQNTPTALDILFIRPDGTVATLVENTVPFSQAKVESGEPVSAVLEIVGGRAAELGIAEGDTVIFPK